MATKISDEERASLEPDYANVASDEYYCDDDFYEDVDDLWSDDKTSTISSTQIKELQPQEIAAYDSRNESVILSKTNALHTSLYFCDKIVDACFKVSNYVPDLSLDQNAAFWLDGVIPILSKNIVNVGRARVIVSHSISSVRQLGIAIFKGAEIINETRGSVKSVEIARKNITSSLAALGKWIEETEKLENSLSIAIFEKQIMRILQIMGPESANFLEEKSNIETQIYAAEAKQKHLFVEVGCKEGEVARYKHLYFATKRYLDRLNRTVDTNEARMDTLRRWNEETEQAIQGILASTMNTVTTVEYRKWWRWWSDSRKKIKTTSEQTPNAERDREKEYYEGIILARMKRLREDENGVNSRRAIGKALNDDLSAYSSALKNADGELRSMNKDFKIRMAKYQKDIDLLYEKLEETKRRQNNIEKSIGLQGHTLIQCLADIRTFGKTIERGTSAFSPLVAILGDIRQMVQSDIELLSSDSEIDINTAARRLMNQVQFLSRYAVDANQILNPPSDIPIEASMAKLAIEGSADAVPRLRKSLGESDSSSDPTKRHGFQEN